MPLLIQSLQFPIAGRGFTAESRRQLHVLGLLMKSFPQVRVVLAAHCDATDPAPATCRQALEAASDYLLTQNVPLKYLVLRNAGAAFPASESGSLALNRRVEIYIANLDSLPSGIRYKEEVLTASGGQFFRQAMNGLFYQVEVPVESRQDGEALWRLFPEGMTLTRADTGKTSFVAGIYLTFRSAEELRKEFVRKGYPQAEVAAFVNGWQLSGEEAGKYVEQFPDLKNFIRR
jgi:hypothetical protein